jgi:hypothetical protein
VTRQGVGVQKRRWAGGWNGGPAGKGSVLRVESLSWQAWGGVGANADSGWAGASGQRVGPGRPGVGG